jgi:hypothetical protein
MSMTQLVVGTAIGFLAAQAGLYGMKHLIGWLQREETRARLRTLIPSPEHAVLGAFIRYAAPLGASAALITLGVWAVGDYLAAKSASIAAMTSVPDPATALPETPAPAPADEPRAPAAALGSAAPQAVAVADVDPYRDADFRVQRRSHRAGSPESLKEKLLERSEAHARSELMKEMQQHVKRSQYDCEAADHANRYLKAGLDVWGFAAWQGKHFPMDGYRGATLTQCKEIKNVIDPSRLNLQSAVAQQSQP